MKNRVLVKAWSAILVATSVLTVTAARASDLERSQWDHGSLYDERYRPQFHFSPPVNWMNDPNGLIYLNGTYHLYYQYNPLLPVAGNQSWGHATSTDLIHWTNLPVAIHCEPGPPPCSGLIFSGSNVYDKNNTSSFFGSGSGGLVAIYTLAKYPANAPSTQVQDIAYSKDGGTTYTKYPGNPVLLPPDGKNPNFRDPFVFWYEPKKSWIMAVSLANDHKILFYSSVNLKNWSPTGGSFGPAGTLGEAYECPNLIQVPIEGSTAKKWVLLISINPGVPQGGSATQYFIGDFDGTTFTADDAVTRWMEYGKDAYAMLTYNNLPAKLPADFQTGAAVAITWVGNWQYSQEVPTSPWRSAMSVPRSLTLRNTAEGLTLVQKPISLASIRGEMLYSNSAEVGDNSVIRVPLEHHQSIEFETTVSANAQQRVSMDLRNMRGEKVSIGYDWDKRQLFVDRGDTKGFDNPFFTSNGAGWLPLPDGKLKLHVLVDRSIVEVFANDGERVSTMLYFMEKPASELRIGATKGRVNVQDLKVFGLRSIWR